MSGGAVLGRSPRRVVDGQVTLVRATGTYDVVSLAVPADPAWDGCRPGQLVVLPADPAEGQLLPAVHWVAGVTLDPVHGTSVDLVLEEGHGLVTGARLRLLAPLGQGFSLPRQPVPTLLVGHEGSAVPLRWLITLLRDRGCPAHVVLSADDPDRHLDLPALRRGAASLVLTSPSQVGSAVARALDGADADRAEAPAVVFASGPRRVLDQVVPVAVAAGRPVRMTALDPGSGVVCGTGVCGQCDVVVDDGRGARALRACLEGPVVPGEWWLDAAR